MNWNGSNLEVKKNSGRFGQQGGRAASLNTFKFIASQVLDNEAMERLNEEPGNENMTFAISNLAKLAKQEKVNTDKVVKEVQEVIDQIYYSKGYASKYITGDNILVPEKLKKAILKISMHGYMEKNNIGSFLFWNPTNLDYFTFGKKDIDTVVDQRLVDTTSAKKTNAALGFRWTDPYPKLFFI